MLNELKDIGLSENEAKVYMAMVDLGPSSVIEIAAKAEINRPTTYVQIESLKKKGLVSTQTKGKKQIFIAESPEHLESMLEGQLRAIESKKSELSGMLPGLMAAYSSSGVRPQVRYFEGKEGLMQMQEVFLKSGVKEVCGISNLDDILAISPGHTKDYSGMRVKKGIRSKLIYSSSKGAILEDNEAKLREVKFIPPENMPFNGDLSVYGNSVMISALRTSISGIIIEHADIADAFRGFFNFLWRFSDKIQ